MNVGNESEGLGPPRTDSVSKANGHDLGGPASGLVIKSRIPPIEVARANRSLVDVTIGNQSHAPALSSLGVIKNKITDLRPTQAPEVELAQTVSYLQSCVPLANSLAGERVPAKWLVEDLLLEGGIYMVGGLPKYARKSLFLVALSKAISSGTDSFMGRACDYGPVYYVNLEDGRERLARRLWDYGFRPGITSGSPGNLYPFWVDTVASDILMKAAVIRQIQPKLAILDPFVEVAALMGFWNENDAAEMSAVVRAWRNLLREMGSTTTMAISHHFRKAGDTIRGSSALQGAFDGLWEIHSYHGDKPRNIRFIIRDSEPLEADVWIEYDDAMGIKVELDGDIVRERTDAERERIYADRAPVNEEKEAAREAEKAAQLAQEDADDYKVLKALFESHPDETFHKSSIEAELRLPRKRVARSLTKLFRDGVISQQGARSGYVLNPINRREVSDMLTEAVIDRARKL